MKLRLFTILLLLSIPAAIPVQGSVKVFTDLDAWTAAAGSSSSDNFGSAAFGGPQPSYLSPLGVTLRRSTLFEDNGRIRTVTTGYDGDLRIETSPSFFESSPNQVFIFETGDPGRNIFFGSEDRFFRTDGFDELVITRLPDRAQQRIRTEYRGQIIRSNAQVTGEFEEAVFGFGFSVLPAGIGPFPGSLRFDVEGRRVTAPVFGFSETFFGVLSTTPIDDFVFSVRRGPLVRSTNNYTNSFCGVSQNEFCLGNGSTVRQFADAGADITQMFVAGGPSVKLSAARAEAIATPEPSTGFLVLSALALAWRLRRR
jgi:hypothetical protein